MRGLINFLLMISFFTAATKILSDNWSILSSAPLAFAISLGLGLLSGWLLARWSYKERLENCYSRISGKDDDIKRRDEKIADLENSEPQSNPPPIEIEAQTEEPPNKLLLPAALPENLSDEDLQNQVLEILMKINETVGSTKAKTSDLKNQKRSIEKDRSLNTMQYSIQYQKLDQIALQIDNIESQITKINSAAISKFNQEYITKAFQIRNILIKRLPKNTDSLSAITYTEVKSLSDLEAIGQDIKLLKQD